MEQRANSWIDVHINARKCAQLRLRSAEQFAALDAIAAEDEASTEQEICLRPPQWVGVFIEAGQRASQQGNRLPTMLFADQQVGQWNLPSV